MPANTCDYDPKVLTGAPIGQFHCPKCGDMVIAGLAHYPPSTINEALLKKILADSDAKWFGIDELEPECAMLSSRDHGYVYEEETGVKDRDAGRRIVTTVKTAHPQLIAKMELIDEWVTVQIEIKEK